MCVPPPLPFTQFRNDADFTDNIVANTGRYVKLFSEAIDEGLPEPSTDVDQAGLRVDLQMHQYFSY